MVTAVKVNGKSYRGLVDTGCSRTLLSPHIQINPRCFYAQAPTRGVIFSFNGEPVPHRGEALSL